ncbi:MAG: OmpA family protein, partial [Gammaproteobacteria bacterium]
MENQSKRRRPEKVGVRTDRYCDYVRHHSRRLLTRLVVYSSLFLGVFSLGVNSTLAQTQPGTTLENIAVVSFAQPSGDRARVESNSVNLVTQLAPTDATVQFVQVGVGDGDDKVINATQCVSGGDLWPLPDARLFSGTTVTAGDSFTWVESELFHGGEPLFIGLQDADQNLSAAELDTIKVTLSFPATGDSEELVLTETDLNSGDFVGYIPTGSGAMAANDCTLQVVSGGQAEVLYTDPNDSVDVAASSALVDPLGVVFDSGTGMPVNGAEVILINQETGMPANVFGDDGVSTYPSQIISGGSATDSSGVSYDFVEGAFRFPLIAPGTYALRINPPPGYSAPSIVPIGDLQQLPGAPYTLVAASFGGDFVVNPGPVIRVDIPLDPSSASLFLQKTTPLNTAAPGDFVPYELRLTNADNVAFINDVRITDRLPAGFRLVQDSVRIDGDVAADPVIAADGRTMTFILGRLNGGQGRRISYVTEVTNSVSGNEATNVAVATGSGRIESNSASTTIKLTEDIFATNSLLIGRVIGGSCDQDVSNDLNGVANTRLYLEDGRYAVTDEGGRFHFEGLEPGAHVVQLDVDSIPVHMEVMPCQQNSRFAGRAFSQFVDLRPGSAWRADFYLQEIPAANGAVDIMLETTPGHGVVNYSLSITGRGNVPIRNANALIMLPDGVEFVAGSAARNGAQIGNPSITGSLLTLALDDRRGEWQDVITFQATISPDASLELNTKAMAMFDAPTKKKQRTPLVENLLVIEPPVSERIEFTLTPKYGTRSAHLKPSDKQDIDVILSQLKDVKNIRIRIEGHTDDVQIAPQNRKEFASNAMLSEARAAGVSRYIQEQLQLLPSQLTVEGKGA